MFDFFGLIVIAITMKKTLVYFSVVKNMLIKAAIYPKQAFSFHNEHKGRMEACVSLLICIVVTDRSNSEIQ